jgi:biotin/methionine sulfoxide reductase
MASAQINGGFRVLQRFPSLCHWGAYTALVEDGRFVNAEPFALDPSPSPLLDALPEVVYSKTRVSRPSVREGWLKRRDRQRTGHDTYVEVDWDTALDLVAEELARVRAEYGASGIFGGSQGWASAGRLHHAGTQLKRFLFAGGGCVDKKGNYSFGTAMFLLPHVVGTASPVTGKVTDWSSVCSHTRLMVAFGGLALKNGQVSSGGPGEHGMETWLRRARQAGVEFVVVSPNRSDAPDFLGAHWISIRPGTDTALLLGMAHELVAQGLHDRGFLEQYCTGYERFEHYLLGQDDAQPKNPEWAARICGVDAADIRALALRLAGTRHMLTMSWSIQRAHHGEQPYWMLITLAAMLGQIGLPGGGFAFGHGSQGGVGNPRPLGAVTPELPAGENPGGIAVPAARLTEMLERPGAEYDFNGQRSRYPDIHLVYWAGGNPFHHHQDLNRLRRAWQRPDTVIVHETHWTATARHADIVLPATTTLERNDLGGASRDRFLFAMHQAIAPVGEARNDRDIFHALAARAGFAASFTDGLDEAAWLRRLYDNARSKNSAVGISMPPFEVFWERGHFELPRPARAHVLFEAFRQDPGAHPLGTPSGKIEIYSSTIAGFNYADCPPHPMWLAPAEWLGAPEAASYPLHLVTTQPPDKLHSQADYGPIARAAKRAGHERIRLSPGDAKSRSLVDGVIVRVYNARGACLATVQVDAGLLQGVASMSTGAWYDPVDDSEQALDRHGNPNVLTLDRGTSKLTQGTSALSMLVEVERWDGEHAVRAHEPPRVMTALLEDGPC